MILVTSEGAETWRGKGWVGQALRSFGVSVRRVELTDEERAWMEAAMVEQGARNRRRFHAIV